MRFKSLMAIATAMAFFGMTPEPASAFGWDRPDQPAGWGHERTVRHWIYRPHYRDVYYIDDPYAYRYVPRGYYPYYNSNYWRKARVKRPRHRLPPYYAAWGANKRGYRHVEWHRRHYGGHRRGDW